MSQVEILVDVNLFHLVPNHIVEGMQLYDY